MFDLTVIAVGNIKLGQGYVLYVSVFLFTGGVSVPACTTGHMTRGGSPSMGVSVWEGLCPRGVLSRGVSVQGESLSRGVSVWGVSVQGGLCLGGFCLESLSEGVFVSLSGGSLSEGSLSGRPPHTVMRGRYASYWNAFLLVYYFVSHMEKQGYHPVLFNLL